VHVELVPLQAPPSRRSSRVNRSSRQRDGRRCAPGVIDGTGRRARPGRRADRHGSAAADVDGEPIRRLDDRDALARRAAPGGGRARSRAGHRVVPRGYGLGTPSVRSVCICWPGLTVSAPAAKDFDQPLGAVAARLNVSGPQPRNCCSSRSRRTGRAAVLSRHRGRRSRDGRRRLRAGRGAVVHGHRHRPAATLFTVTLTLL